MRTILGCCNNARKRWRAHCFLVSLLVTKTRFKGTVSLILTNRPCKDVHVRFTTVPFIPWSDQKCRRYYRFSSAQVIFLKNPQLKYSFFKLEKKDFSFILDQTKILRISLWIGYFIAIFTCRVTWNYTNSPLDINN